MAAAQQSRDARGPALQQCAARARTGAWTIVSTSTQSRGYHEEVGALVRKLEVGEALRLDAGIWTLVDERCGWGNEGEEWEA
jgi:hypothetical protein